MISDDVFLDLVDGHVGRNLRDLANRAQRDAVTHSPDCGYSSVSNAIVAGPGSGKTTVLVLRALRHVLVEDVKPEHILITTFTRKAARELRTRLVGLGYFTTKRTFPIPKCGKHIDINRCRIDTLDGTVHDVLTEFRPAGQLAPALADTSASLLIFKREVFQSMYWPNQQTVDTLLSRYTFDGRPPGNQREALGTTKRVLERLIQDQVDTAAYAQSGASRAACCRYAGRISASMCAN